MNYFTLAMRSIRRNARANFAYFLSSVIFVFIYVISDLFVNSRSYFYYELDGDTFGFYFLIYLFLFILFLLISIGLFLETRKKEIALYRLHGTSLWQISLVIFLENMAIGFFVIVIGVILGLSFYKLFLILIAPMLHTPVFPFEFSSWKIFKVIVTFILIYLIHSVFVVIYLQFSNVATLLKDKHSPKVKSKYSIFLFFLGVLLLFTPYITKYSEMNDVIYGFLLPFAAIACGCYLIFKYFSALYIWMTRHHNSEHPRRMIWKSQLLFQHNSVPFLGVLAAFFLWISISSISTLIANYQDAVKTVENYPFTYILYANQEGKSDFPEYDSLIQQELERNNISFKKHAFEAVILREKSGAYIRAVKYSDYRAMAEILSRKKPKLLDEQQIIYLAAQNSINQKKKPNIDTIQLKTNNIKFQIQSLEKNIIPNLDAIVVSDEKYDQLIKIKTIRNFSPYVPLSSEKYSVYYVPKWMKGNPQPFDAEENIFATVQSKVLLDGYYMSNRPASGLGASGVASLLESIVYFFAGASFLYFACYVKFEEEQVQYQLLSKLGWSEKEMRQLGTIQISFLFFVPFGLAVVEHILIDLSRWTAMFSAMGIQLIGLVVYFLFVRFSYLKKALPTREQL